MRRPIFECSKIYLRPGMMASRPCCSHPTFPCVIAIGVALLVIAPRVQTARTYTNAQCTALGQGVDCACNYASTASTSACGCGRTDPDYSSTPRYRCCECGRQGQCVRSYVDYVTEPASFCNTYSMCWGPWATACNTACGYGKMQRSRTCNLPPGVDDPIDADPPTNTPCSAGSSPSHSRLCVPLKRCSLRWEVIDIKPR